jgi:hypothetical protein
MPFGLDRCNFFFFFFAVSAATMFFSGTAREWIAGVRRAISEGEMSALTSWEDLKALMTEWIRPVDTMMLNYEAFISVCQGKNQSVKEYITAFNAARMKVSVPPICDPLLCFFYLRGLRPHLRTHVMAREPKTLREYIRVSNAISDLTNAVPGKQTSSSGSSTSDGSSKPSSSNGTKPRCTHCNKVGHVEERCYKKYPKLAPPKDKKVRFDAPAEET